MQKFEAELGKRYDVKRELRFPFGNAYGWGYKYSHKTQHLCYLFFEKGAFTVMFQISGREAAKVEALYPDLLEKSRELWKTRYPCGSGGGWLRYRVFGERELADVMKLMEIRKKPARK